jgi:hypothetical protein
LTIGKLYEAKKQKMREENVTKRKEEEDFIIMKAKIKQKENRNNL